MIIMSKIFKYEITNAVEWDCLEDYISYNIFSYIQFSEEEFLEIVEEACKIIKEKYDKDDDFTDMVTYVYAYLVSTNDIFFDIENTHSVEINTRCCKHDYKVKPFRCGCQGD